MKKKIYQIENESGLNFSIQKTQPFIEGEDKRILPSEVLFLIEGVTRDNLTKDGDLVLSISKAAAKKLAHELLRMA